jgi:FtsP/CotA-like multicopper oxidase with cupredoxin domain
VVRFNFMNRTPMAHPMHLHGHVFRVLLDGMGTANAPLRDTVVVWPNAKVSIEFVAYNPGTWFFHCHNIWHLATGMAQAVRYKAPTA